MAKENKGSLGTYAAVAGIAVLIIAAIIIVCVNIFGSSPRDFVVEDGVITAYKGDSRTVRLPSNATSIGDFAFRDHTEIEKIVVGSNINTIGEGAFYGCTNLKDVKLASAVAYINDGVFGECYALESFTVPKDCVYLNSGAFYNDTALKEFKVEKGNTVFTTDDGILYLSDMSAIVVYPLARNESEFVIPEGVEFVAAWSFYGAQALEKITLPSTVTEIGEDAFGDTGIKEIVFPDSVAFVGQDAFSKCKALESISFGAGIEALPSSCFAGCTALETLTIPETLTSFGPNVFLACENLGEVTFEGDILYIETNSFGSDPKLVLCGADGSNLQNYAESCGYEFKAIR